MSVLRGRHGSKLDPRQSLRLGPWDSPLHVVFSRQGEMRTRLVIELPIKVALLEDREKPDPRLHDTHCEPPSLHAARIRPMTVAWRSHSVRSAFICRFPAFVIA